MHLNIDGYSIEYIPNQNRIVIYLPQTYATVTNTVSPVEDRKTELSENDLVILLQMVRYMFKGDMENALS